jgi:alpha-glucosidase (family GH31 glycosyl hydrolase)
LSNIVKGDKYRISVLTDRLIRLEYSDEGRFEDRPSFAFINRDGATCAAGSADGDRCQADTGQDGAIVRIDDREDSLVIETAALLLTYDKKEFSSYGLTIKLKENGVVWNYGDSYTDWSNLGGTARTLDDADGRVRLEKGIFGRDGYAAIDDSKTPVIEDGEFVNRQEGAIDVYFFGYGKDYYGGLRDFCKISGRMPMIPRYALGNWWSRYYKYTEASYMDVVEQFAKEGIPLSVAVIDMDWHLTEIDPKYGSGWTGFTWNEEFFPDYKRFLSKLHDNNLAVTLNLHPADGIRPFEAMYDDMAKEMGLSECESGADKKASNGECGQDNVSSIEREKCHDLMPAIEFDFGDKQFRDAYFDVVMHPYEEDGVDFWWIDWQQGTGKKCGDVDPLLLLNHYHYEDQEKRNLRPMIFSRYAGVGSHRYPVGFSGDSHVTWKSLEFQPYFTSTASNIAYNNWSHDIGGHMLGDKNLDRLIRWIEYGVFSPIMRIHSSCSPFFNKEPWLLDEPYRSIVGKFMRLRHQLIPYLYTENHRAYAECKPLVRPMYYDYSDCAETYEVGNEYKFGENLIVSAVTGPDDEELRLGVTRAYIPAGRWYDIFNGLIYQSKSGQVKKLYRKLSELPVLLPAGGIVPMACGGLDEDNRIGDDKVSGGKTRNGNINDTGNPAALYVLIGGGADGEYTMYEDDGISMNFEKGAFVNTRFKVKYDEAAKKMVIAVNPAEGDVTLIPAKRSYEFEVYGVKADAACTGDSMGNVIEVGTLSNCDCTGKSIVVKVPATSVKEKIIVELTGVEILENDYKQLVFEILDRAWIKTIHKDMIYDKLQKLDRAEFTSWLQGADVSENLKSAINEILL